VVRKGLLFLMLSNYESLRMMIEAYLLFDGMIADNHQLQYNIWKQLSLNFELRFNALKKDIEKIT